MKPRRSFTILKDELLAQPMALRRLLAWSLPTMLPPLLSGRFIALATDQGFFAHRPAIGVGWLAAFGATMVVGALGLRQTLRSLGSVVEPLRNSLIRAVVIGTIRTSAAAGTRPDARGVAQLTEQIEIVRDVAGSLLLGAQQIVFTLGGAVAGVLLLSPVLLLVIGPPFVVSLILLGRLLATLLPLQRSAIAADEAVASAAGAAFHGIRDIIACGAQDRTARAMAAHVGTQAASTTALARIEALRITIVAVGVRLPLALLLIAASWLIRSEHLTIGDILGAVTYVTVTAAPVVTYLATTVGSSALQLLAALDRISSAATVPAVSQQPQGSRPSCRTGITRYDVELRGVTFAYSPHADPILDDVSLSLPQGSHLAIVGPSGIGKSTIGELVAGVRQPQHGEILIGGMPITGIAESYLRNLVGLLPQESYVFTGTLRENLTYLRPGAGTGELRCSIDELGLAELVERIGGLDSEIGPAGLSAGERQLIALARMHLSQAQIVILDEATCYLDGPAEARAERALARRSCSLLVIAHRMSSALRAKQILLVSGSEPVLGTHESLLACSPFYADVAGRWHQWTSESTQQVQAAATPPLSCQVSDRSPLSPPSGPAYDGSWAGNLGSRQSACQSPPSCPRESG